MICRAPSPVSQGSNERVNLELRVKSLIPGPGSIALQARGQQTATQEPGISINKEPLELSLAHMFIYCLVVFAGCTGGQKSIVALENI